MSIISGVGAGLGGAGDSGGALGSFYDFTIDNSVRMSDAGNTTLQWQAGTPSSSTTWTMSVWLKKYNPEGTQAANEFFSAGSSGSAYALFSFRQTNQQFTHQMELPGARNKNFYNRMYRDPSAWFHLVLRANLGESTQADRLRLYINGEQQTHTADGVTQSTWSYINQSGITQNWGGKSGIASGNPGCDYYFADINFTDGQSYAPTEFGETKDGVWIPKDPSVTYGNNGYRLEFKQTGTGADANGIGADTSGNGNHFTSAGLEAHDIVPDTPTNNWSIMNPLKINQATKTFSEGNLDIYSAQTGINPAMTSTFGVSSGKWYWESYIRAQGNASNIVGIASHPNDLEYQNYAGFLQDWMYGYTAGGQKRNNNSASSYGATWTTGDIIGVALDLDAGAVYFYKNGSVQNSGTAAYTSLSGTFSAYNLVYAGGAQVLNFGQDDTFAGNKTTGSANASDSNGLGQFYYTPPSGYNALCASNLPDITIGPGQSSQADDHFDTKLYTGTGSTLNITGINFQPDWIWAKRRSDVQEGRMTDSVRGTNSQLRPATTNDETTFNNAVTSFNSDGFTLGADTGPGSQSFNYYTDNHVAWLWKAGTAFSNDASATGVGTIDSTGSVNQEAGFAIISYTGNIQSGQTIAHGLGGVPEMIWAKNRDASANWVVFTKDLTSEHTLYLNTTGKENNSGTTWGSHTSTVFGVDDDPQSNGDGNATIAYLFRSIEGYSKIGIYTGNNDADGPFSFTGFLPAFLLLKRIDTAGSSWLIYDNKRDTYNQAQYALFPNNANAEYTSNLLHVDFVSNGFKIRNDTYGETNADGAKYIFLAFAEAPFKFANAR